MQRVREQKTLPRLPPGCRLDPHPRVAAPPPTHQPTHPQQKMIGSNYYSLSAGDLRRVRRFAVNGGVAPGWPPAVAGGLVSCPGTCPATAGQLPGSCRAAHLDVFDENSMTPWVVSAACSRKQKPLPRLPPGCHLAPHPELTFDTFGGPRPGHLVLLCEVLLLFV